MMTFTMQVYSIFAQSMTFLFIQLPVQKKNIKKPDVLLSIDSTQNFTIFLYIKHRKTTATQQQKQQKQQQQQQQQQQHQQQ